MPRGTPGVFNLASIGTLFEERESKGRLQTSTNETERAPEIPKTRGDRFATPRKSPIRRGHSAREDPANARGCRE